MKQKPNEESYSRGSKAAILSSKIRAEQCPVALTIRRPLMSLAKIGQEVNWATLQGIRYEWQMRKRKWGNLFPGSLALKGRKALSEEKHKMEEGFDLKL